VRGRLRWVLGLTALALVSAACAPNALQDSLQPHGSNARTIDNLFRPVFWIAAAVFFLVEGLILYFLFKYRHRPGRDRIPPQIHGNTRLEVLWTILPVLVLVGVAVPTVATLFDLARKPTGANVVNVTVVGHQWWWEFDYTDEDAQVASGTPLRTANELVVPVDRPVYLSLNCDPDAVTAIGRAVIHSFWIPELFGKQDCIPGHINHISFSADSAGTYYGQCYEFCGLSHANMRARVRALSGADYAAWLAGQKQDAATPPAGSLAAQGMNLFRGTAAGEGGQCIACHAVQGLQTLQGQEVAGVGGPNLTHFASRDCFAGCSYDVHDQAQVAAWLRSPPAQKPGSFMPDYDLSEAQIKALVAYLEQLT
jgi:cytochrome c oxidase subunit II